MTKGTIAALARVADLASDEGVAAIVGPLAAALPDKSRLNQFDDAFNELDGGSGRGIRLGLALANELQAVGKTTTANENPRRGDGRAQRRARELRGRARGPGGG